MSPLIALSVTSTILTCIMAIAIVTQYVLWLRVKLRAEMLEERQRQFFLQQRSFMNDLRKEIHDQ